MLSGIVPFIALELKSNVSKSFKLPIDDGIEPEKELLWRYRDLKCLKCPIESGICPLNLLPTSCNASKLALPHPDRPATRSTISPLISLFDRYKGCSLQSFLQEIWSMGPFIPEILRSRTSRVLILDNQRGKKLLKLLYPRRKMRRAVKFVVGRESGKFLLRSRQMQLRQRRKHISKLPKYLMPN